MFTNMGVTIVSEWEGPMFTNMGVTLVSEWGGPISGCGDPCS